MYRLKVTILMLCLILSGALCYASGAAGTENEKRLNNPGFLPELFNISHVVQEWHATILESVNTNYPVPIDE